jgi:hypothetical protein
MYIHFYLGWVKMRSWFKPLWNSLHGTYQWCRFQMRKHGSLVLEPTVHRLRGTHPNHYTTRHVIQPTLATRQDYDSYKFILLVSHTRSNTLKIYFLFLFLLLSFFVCVFFFFFFLDEVRLRQVWFPVKLTGKYWILEGFSLVIFNLQTQDRESHWSF